MNINLDSLLVGNHQKNAQKRQEEVVVVDSEIETVTESTDDEMKPNAPKKVDSGSNKENANQVVIESTDDLIETPNNADSNGHENNAMDVTETEEPKDNETENIENNAMDVTETEEPNDNETENIENNAMDVTETEANKENETDKTVPENNEQNVAATEANKDNETDKTVPENNEQNVAETEANKDNETDKTVPENNEQNVAATEANKDNETDKNVPENNAMDVTDTETNKDDKPANTGDESSDKDVTDTEANNDNKTENTEPEANAKDVNPTEQNKEKGTENTDNTDTEQNKENKDRKAKPSELKEKDPILEAFCNVQPGRSRNIARGLQSKKLATSKVSETDIKTQNGTVNVKEYSLLKSPVRKDRSLACTECDVKKTTIAELTKHIKEAHPGFKYKCSQCERLFDTYNGYTKHEHKHYLLKYACVFCIK